MKSHMLYVHIGIASRGNYNVYIQHMLLKTTEKIGKLHFPSIMSIVFTSFKHPKLPINIKFSVTTANCLYLHDSYISKFECMSYLFANLLVAWL